MPTGCAAVRCSLRHLLAPPQGFQLLGAVFVRAAVHNMNQWVRLGLGVYPNISFPKPVRTMPDKIFLFFRLSSVRFLLWHTNDALRHTLALAATAWEVAEKQFYFAEMFRMENLLCWGFLSFFLFLLPVVYVLSSWQKFDSLLEMELLPCRYKRHLSNQLMAGQRPGLHAWEESFLFYKWWSEPHLWQH